MRQRVSHHERWWRHSGALGRNLSTQDDSDCHDGRGSHEHEASAGNEGDG